MNCKTCKFWQQFEENTSIGMCSGIGVMKAGFRLNDPASVAITYTRTDMPLGDNPPISDYIVRTQADFYCASYYLKEMETDNGTK